MNDFEIRMWCIERAQSFLGRDTILALAMAAEIEDYIRNGTLTEAAKRAWDSRNKPAVPYNMDKALREMEEGRKS